MGINTPNGGGDKKGGVTRRRFLGTMAAGAVATKLDPPPRMMAEPARASAHSVVAPVGAEHAEATEHAEHEGGLSAKLDMGTALYIGLRFFHNVIAPGLKEAFPKLAENSIAKVLMAVSSGKGLDSGTAMEMSALAFARIALLKQFGGHEGEHLAGHELEEIKGGLIPLPVLVLLSDFTNEALKVNEKAIMAANDNTIEEQEGEVKEKAKFIKFVDDFLKTESIEDYASIQRPGLGVSQQEWEKHAEKVSGDIAKKVGQIAAIASVMAPLGTTYSSSIVANNMKKPVLRMLYEHAYAKQVIAKKVQGETLIEVNGIEAAATAEADELFNGTWGFSKLMITLSANTQGSFGLGDPPEIYFLINNIKNPKTLLKGHLVGALNSEIYSNALTALWLKKAGIVGVGSSLKELLAAQVKTISALGESLADSDLRDVSFNDGRKFVKKIRTALNDENDPSGELRKALNAIPEAKLQGSVRDYLKRKSALISGLQAKADSIPDLSVIDAENFAESDIWNTLMDDSISQKEKERLTSAVLLKIQNAEGEKLAGLMESLLGEVDMTGLAGNAEVSGDDEEGTEYAELTEQQLRAVREIQDAFFSESKGDKKSKIAEAMKFLGKSEEDGNSAEAFFDALSGVDEETCQRALQIFTNVSTGEPDAVAGLEHNAESGDTVGEATEHASHAHKGDKVAFKKLLEDNPLIGALNHNAKEVLWALLTQIPSVPALVRIATKMLPALVGVKEGEAPNPGQLMKIVGLTLTLTGVMSGVADNVAAYMFCRTVLFDFFGATFGKEAFEQNKELQGDIDIIACKTAEQAGSLTKVGNGPNFSQNRLVIVKDPSNAQGISIDVQELTMGETLSNGFSWVANGTFIAMGTGFLCNQIKKLEAENDNKKTASVDSTVIGRRQLVRGLYERVTGGGKKTA